MPDIGESNRLLRDKYFVDAEDVLTRDRQRTATPRRAPERGRVIDASRVLVSKRTVLPRPATAGNAQNSIRVNVVKENNRIVGIKIECPCGRHAELNCEYEADQP